MVPRRRSDSVGAPPADNHPLSPTLFASPRIALSTELVAPGVRPPASRQGGTARRQGTLQPPIV